MSADMGEMEDGIKILVIKLMESLGDKYDEYLKLVRSWFRMKDDRPQLEAEFKSFLTPHQNHLHTQLLIHLLYKSADIREISSKSAVEPSRPQREHYYNTHKFQEGFEPIDPTFYVVTERQEVHGEVPPYMVHERLLPDQSATLARLMYSAWELGLEGSQPNAAEFLTVATQHFLKNIITAVITRKKGYKCSQNGFIHSLGTAMPNPWLHNVAKHRSEQFHSLKFDGRLNGMNGILKPAERPSREDLEQDAVFRLSASSAEEETGPISLYDLIITLQADVCHAYQILHSNGIPDENIVVMMADDIAYYQDNPTPGVIVNYPGGPDVYNGVPKDYIGADVTPENFLNILAGNRTAMRGIGSGKVIESGPDDLIFVNFVDHGGPGVLYFPNEELLADQFLKTIEIMTAQSKFSKLILYIEACHAGSMFDNLLPDTTNVFALTAADPHESSYACYYDETRETYLGDVFSVIWMNDTEHESLPQESLHHQFEKVRTYTNTSHVEEYGDLDIGITKLKAVLGFRMRLLKSVKGENSTSNVQAIPQHPMDTIDNMDVPLVILEKKRKSTKDKEESRNLKLEIHNLMKKRQIVDKLFKEIVVRVSDDIEHKKSELRTSFYGLNRNIFPCYRKLYSTFSSNCMSFVQNPYTRVHLQKFVNICSTKWMNHDKAVDAILSTCRELLGGLKIKNIM